MCWCCARASRRSHLRDAIPDQELSVPRGLMLDSADATASYTELRGRRVHLDFRVKETGAFDTFADVDLDGPRVLMRRHRSGSPILR